MLKILWKRGEIAPEEQFLLLSTIFCYLMLDFNVKTGIRQAVIRNNGCSRQAVIRDNGSRDNESGQYV